jgi:arylsulfatase A-like enzyme
MMRFLYIDVDTLRPDHLGCYGYARPTSPSIDRLAEQGIRFDQLYVSDSPCLPSRSALATGRFGVHNGVVNHGGRRAEPFPATSARQRVSDLARSTWFAALRQAGLWCTTISTFGERHSAFHWYAGCNEVINLGLGGLERADQVGPVALEWLQRRGREDNWFLHVHFWDPHTPYRSPASYGNPLDGTPTPTWIDEDVLRGHQAARGPHTARRVFRSGHTAGSDSYPRQPRQVTDAGDVQRVFDGYDEAIRYSDDHVGQILDVLDRLGVAEDTAVLLSSDHGENLGELGIYCDHQTADVCTHRVPGILSWPGVAPAVADGLLYQIDLAATVLDLLGVAVPDGWDGASVADDLRAGRPPRPRSQLVLSCAAWTVQRAVRFDRWLYIRTYHDASHGFPDAMLFDIDADPHEQSDLVADRPDVAGRAAGLLLDWETAAMRRSPTGEDPLWTVLHEGGGYYARPP